MTYKDDRVKNHKDISCKTSTAEMAELFRKITGVHNTHKLIVLGYTIRNICSYLLSYKHENFCRVFIYFEHPWEGCTIKHIDYGKPSKVTPKEILDLDNISATDFMLHYVSMKKNEEEKANDPR